MTAQAQNNNLNYLIDLTFTNANKLFVFLFERIEENNVTKDHSDSFSHYYVPNVEIKDFNVLIDGKLISMEKLQDKIMVQKCLSSLKNQKKLLLSFFKIL